ncbi:MAG TPA: hypothetical protein VGS09_12930 [Actinomycetota bacterium]|jgi:hypothetical protein|nr:hypothetical protein [Actinomycetota bacterium]
MGSSFERWAGWAAVAVGVGALAYAVVFAVIVLSDEPPTWVVGLWFFLLMLGGLLTVPALVALYQRLRATDPGIAMWGLLLGLVGAVGAAVHGAYDLANVIRPVEGAPPGDLPNPIDPRGFLTFGFMALALFLVSWLIVRGGQLPRGLGSLGYLSAALLVVIYLGRLIAFDPKNPILLVAALLAGLVVNPAWWIWLGTSLLRSTPRP